MNTNEKPPKYSDISIQLPDDLKADFLIKCKQAGLDAGEVKYFSVGAPSVLRVLYETLTKTTVMVPKLLGILKMFNQQRNIRVEVYTDKKIIDLKGYSEEAQRLLEKCDGIRLSHREEKNKLILIKK